MSQGAFGEAETFAAKLGGGGGWHCRDLGAHERMCTFPAHCWAPGETQSRHLLVSSLTSGEWAGGKA